MLVQALALEHILAEVFSSEPFASLGYGQAVFRRLGDWSQRVLVVRLADWALASGQAFGPDDRRGDVAHQELGVPWRRASLVVDWKGLLLVTIPRLPSWVEQRQGGLRHWSSSKRIDQ